MMTAYNPRYGRRIFRPTLLRSRSILQAALLVAIALFSLGSIGSSSAGAETRTLRMYFTHTKESATITFKRNGRYVNRGLRKANRFLRDWRRKEPTKMDPALLDLVWEVYQKSGSRKPIHVISGYRSPRTNKMLRRRGRKVANKSQHTRGKALDFFMPDVSVKKLRALGLKAHRGGVGYYRGSFVHLDTGRVRHWPRMSKRQLARVFPRGKTIHVPSNGKPLRGYRTAMANIKRGRNADGSKRNTPVRRSVLARLFSRSGNDGDENEATSSAVIKKSPKPKRKPKAKPAPKPVVVAAKPKKPAPKKPSGPDPFSLENKAVKSTKQKQEEERKRKEAEDAKTIALAEAQAAEIKAAEEAAQLAALVPQRVSVPRRRPSLRGANTQLALAPASDENRLTPVAATELALATPPAVSQVLRPSVDIPNTVAQTQPIQQASIPQQDVSALNERARTALARGRLVPAPSSQSAQAIAEKVRLALPTSAPKRKLPTVLASLQPTPETKSVFESGLKPATNALPELSSEPAPKPILEASLKPSVSATDPPETLRKPLPKARPQANAVREASVPVPPKPDKLKAVVTAVATDPAPEPKIKLELGDLDGRSVKKWAVAQSTRVGPIAKLRAPNYRNGTNRLAPSSVYSAGFGFNRSPLRADRFTGRALTRVAFADFSRN